MQGEIEPEMAASSRYAQAEQEAENKGWTPGKVIAAGVAATALVVGVQNFDFWLLIKDLNAGADESLIPDIPGCAPEGPIEVGNNTAIELGRTEETSIPVVGSHHNSATNSSNDAARLQQIENGAKDKHSSAEGVHPGVADVMSSVHQYYDQYMAHPQFTYVSQISGRVFTFYSDVDNPTWLPYLDPEAFDEAYHIGLTAPTQYPNPIEASQANCLERRFIDEQEASGTEWKILIPGRGGDSCLALTGVIYVTGNDRSQCVSPGATPPFIHIEWLWYEVVQERAMILTFGGRDFTDLIAHEGIHASLTDTNTPVRFRPDEAWVYLQEGLRADAIDALQPVLTTDPSRMIKIQHLHQRQRQHDRREHSKTTDNYLILNERIERVTRLTKVKSRANRRYKR